MKKFLVIEVTTNEILGTLDVPEEYNLKKFVDVTHEMLYDKYNCEYKSMFSGYDMIVNDFIQHLLFVKYEDHDSGKMLILNFIDFDTISNYKL